MKVPLRIGLLLLGLALTTSVSGKPAPKPLPAEIRAAWEKTGVDIGWVARRQESWLSFTQETSERDVWNVPGFRVSPRIRWQYDLIAKLPAPEQGFGLDLSHTEVTDAELKELATLKHLQALNLFGNKLTGTGLKAMAGTQTTTGARPRQHENNRRRPERTGNT